jgi:hypothetical protein
VTKCQNFSENGEHQSISETFKLPETNHTTIYNILAIFTRLYDNETWTLQEQYKSRFTGAEVILKKNSRSLTTVEIKIFSKKLKHKQFWKKINYDKNKFVQYNMFVEWTDPEFRMIL